MKYREIFFKETDIKFNVDYKGKFKEEEKENEYRNVFIIKEYRNKFEIEKMGGLSVGIYYTHINPFIYCALKENIEKEFEKKVDDKLIEVKDRKYFIKYDKNNLSYAKIENIIEGLFCKEDYWRIAFAENFKVSDDMGNEFELKKKKYKNRTFWFLKHSSDKDTIENLRNLLQTLNIENS